MTGREMYALAERLFFKPRSLTGSAVRETLDTLGRIVPLERHRVTSGTEVYDWTVPPEWNVEEAYLEGPDELVCDWGDNYLHLVGYSEIGEWSWTRKEAEKHLYSIPSRPAAIPYVTSYYSPWVGFTIPHKQRVALPEGRYSAVVRGTKGPGQLDYADLVVPGISDREIMFSTYVCHPNLANDNVSGMVVQIALAAWILSAPRRFSYRFVFVPETIGALVYLSTRLDHLRAKLDAGFVLNCLGDPGPFSRIPTRSEKTYADRVGRCWSPNGGHTWMARGSDERQYASPGADLPVVRLCRSETQEYPEYHTSDDNLELISAGALADSFARLQRLVEIVEANSRWRAVHPGDADLGRRGLYPTLGFGTRDKTHQHVLSYCDGEHDVIAIAEKTGLPEQRVIASLHELVRHGLVDK